MARVCRSPTRQRVAARGRRVNTRCQGEEGLPHPLALFYISIMSCCPLRVCASRCRFPSPPMAQVRRCSGVRARPQGQQGSRLMSGRYEPCCAVGCRRGPSVRKKRDVLMIVASHDECIHRTKPEGLEEVWTTGVQC